MSVDMFIQGKSRQLQWYVNAYLHNEIEHQELCLMVWDILEEWTQVESRSELPSLQEQMFWHLIQLLQRWPEHQLKGNLFIRSQLQTGTQFLTQGGPIPFACEGLRP